MCPLICSICHEYFSDPRVLPCGHTFCLACLIKTINHKCSLCKRDWHLASATLLPVNYVVQDIVKESAFFCRHDCRNCRHEKIKWCQNCQHAICAVAEEDGWHPEHNVQSFSTVRQELLNELEAKKQAILQKNVNSLQYLSAEKERANKVCDDLRKILQEEQEKLNLYFQQTEESLNNIQTSQYVHEIEDIIKTIQESPSNLTTINGSKKFLHAEESLEPDCDNKPLRGLIHLRRLESKDKLQEVLCRLAHFNFCPVETYQPQKHDSLEMYYAIEAHDKATISNLLLNCDVRDQWAQLVESDDSESDSDDVVDTHYTVLSLAIWNNNTAIIEWLLESGISPNYPQTGCPPLFCAVIGTPNIASVQKLLAFNADTTQIYEGETILQCAKRYGASSDLISVLTRN